MTSRVDHIFRGSSTVRRGHRSSKAIASIFRTIDADGDAGTGENNGEEDRRQDDEGGSYVASLEPRAWPPHQAALAEFESEDESRVLRRAAPLSGDDEDRDDKCWRSPRTLSSAAPYYKIEFVSGYDGDTARLTCGGSSQQRAPGRDEQIRLADPRATFQAPPLLRASPIVKHEDAFHPASRAKAPCILRASPIIGHEGVELAVDVDLDSACSRRPVSHQHQQWAVSDSGRIFAVPPAPCRASRTLSDQKKTCYPTMKEEEEDLTAPPVLARSRGEIRPTPPSPSCVSMTRSYYRGNAPSPIEKIAEGEASRDPQDLSVPPLLVKAHSGYSSSIGYSSSMSSSEHSSPASPPRWSLLPLDRVHRFVQNRFLKTQQEPRATHFGGMEFQASS